jgi:hypothetical protein
MIAVPGSHVPNDNTVTTQVIVTTPNTPAPTTPVSPVAKGVRLRAEAKRTFHGPVARLSDPQAGDDWPLTALISWGDGTPTASGRIRGRGKGRLQVIGSHSYAMPGRFEVLVTIRDDAGHELAAEGMAIVRAHR